MLAPYACQPDASRGRLFPERMSSFRSPFQRDRDRIIHSSAFRRLKHKTQVFVEHEGDYYRTRLTHSIEVAQVARTISRVLGLNEDLAEAVALPAAAMPAWATTPPVPGGATGSVGAADAGSQLFKDYATMIAHVAGVLKALDPARVALESGSTRSSAPSANISSRTPAKKPTAPRHMQPP